MSHRHRLPLLALLWLFTAAGVGLFWAWLLRPDPVREQVVVYRDNEHMGADGIGEASLITPPLTAPPARGAAHAEPSPSAPTVPPPPRDPDAPPPPLASVLVSVFEADGSPAESGTVYALGAAEGGTDDEQHIFSAAIEEAGPVRLRLPMAGLYDIGIRGDRGTALLTDFRAVPGDGNEATLRLPAGTPVLVRIEGDWPPKGAENSRLNVNFWTEDDPRQFEFPGRNDRSWASGTAVLTESTGSSDPLEAGRLFQVWSELQETAPWVAGSAGPLMNSPRFFAVPDREAVRPGETVVFRVRTASGILLRPGDLPAPAESKKQALPVMSVNVSRGDRLLASLSMSIARGRPPGTPAPFTVLTVEPGPCLISWSGAGLAAGEMKADLRPGEVFETEIPAREDPEGQVIPFQQATPVPVPGESGSEVPADEVAPLPLLLESLPPGTEGNWHLFCSTTPEEDGPWESSFDAEDGQPELAGEWRRVPEIAAVVPPFLASDFAPPPASGPLRLALRPGGLLAVVPAEVLPPGLGTLRIRRADGRPIPMADQGGWGYQTALREVVAEPGLLIGPFPAGTITFELRLGGLRLPDVRATVVAERIEVLRISR